MESITINFRFTKANTIADLSYRKEIVMSVFNATYENLLTDGYITLNELSSVFHYIELL